MEDKRNTITPNDALFATASERQTRYQDCQGVKEGIRDRAQQMDGVKYGTPE